MRPSRNVVDAQFWGENSTPTNREAPSDMPERPVFIVAAGAPHPNFLCLPIACEASTGCTVTEPLARLLLDSNPSCSHGVAADAPTDSCSLLPAGIATPEADVQGAAKSLQASNAEQIQQALSDNNAEWAARLQAAEEEAATRAREALDLSTQAREQAEQQVCRSHSLQAEIYARGCWGFMM